MLKSSIGTTTYHGLVELRERILIHIEILVGIALLEMIIQMQRLDTERIPGKQYTKVEGVRFVEVRIDREITGESWGGKEPGRLLHVEISFAKPDEALHLHLDDISELANLHRTLCPSINGPNIATALYFSQRRMYPSLNNAQMGTDHLQSHL